MGEEPVRTTTSGVQWSPDYRAGPDPCEELRLVSDRGCGCGYRYATTDGRAHNVFHRHGDQEVPMTRQADQ